jgi:2-polyprenyl-3-methyl-5-hydroxy-6-metoxy-1,4-benzoquinol methylase
VIGADISPEVIRLGREHEQAEPFGVAYQVCDATNLPRLGRFDLVTAVYPLNHATSQDELLGMCDMMWQRSVSALAEIP